MAARAGRLSAPSGRRMCDPNSSTSCRQAVGAGATDLAGDRRRRRRWRRIRERRRTVDFPAPMPPVNRSQHVVKPTWPPGLSDLSASPTPSDLPADAVNLSVRRSTEMTGHFAAWFQSIKWLGVAGQLLAQRASWASLASEPPASSTPGELDVVVPRRQPPRRPRRQRRTSPSAWCASCAGARPRRTGPPTPHAACRSPRAIRWSRRRSPREDVVAGLVVAVGHAVLRRVELSV